MSGLYAPPPKRKTKHAPPLTLEALTEERERLKMACFGDWYEAPPTKVTKPMRLLLNPTPLNQPDQFAMNKAYRQHHVRRAAAAWAYEHDFEALVRVLEVTDHGPRDEALAELVGFETRRCGAHVITHGLRLYGPTLPACPSVAKVLAEKGIDWQSSP